MQINHKILSIPPYISTSWKNVIALKTEEKGNLLELSIILQDGSSICIPGMEHPLIEAIFSFHAKHLSCETTLSHLPPSFLFPSELTSPSSPSLVDIKFLSKLDSLCQHDPENSDAPKLPEAMLEQFTLITKSIPFENIEDLPKPQPHCNCPYCQITQAIHLGMQKNPVLEDSQIEDEVSENDLTFTSWIIEPLDNKGYKVTHPDHLEKTHIVSLKTPIECSCGSDRCEHILAVLHS